MRMVIDLILNRKDGAPYSPRAFYSDVSAYGATGEEIATALDSGEEADVKKALCFYVLGNDYNPAICEYVNSVMWLEPTLPQCDKCKQYVTRLDLHQQNGC